MFLPDSYAVIDFETSGLNPWQDRIIEVGVQVVWGQGVHQKPQALLVKAGVPLPREVVAITGISDQDLEAGVSTAEALAWLWERAGELPLVGHNLLEFDALFLNAEARRHHDDVWVTKGLEGETWDTMAMYKAHLLGFKPDKREDRGAFFRRALGYRAYGARYSLDAACRAMKVEMEGVQRHRGGGDVVLTQRLFEKLRPWAVGVGL